MPNKDYDEAVKRIKKAINVDSLKSKDDLKKALDNLKLSNNKFKNVMFDKISPDIKEDTTQQNLLIALATSLLSRKGKKLDSNMKVTQYQRKGVPYIAVRDKKGHFITTGKK